VELARLAPPIVRGLHRIAGTRSSHKILGATSGNASPDRGAGEIPTVSGGARAKVTFNVDSRDSLENLVP
jgi:hypothetical protein